MKFRVRRTSEWRDDQKPCAEATKARFKYFDVRTCKSPEEFDATVAARFPAQGLWHERGSEHKILRGPRGGATGIQRRIEDEDGWVVDIDGLDGLLAFEKKYGDLVISTKPAEADSEDDYMPSIEIYDGYRE